MTQTILPDETQKAVKALTDRQGKELEQLEGILPLLCSSVMRNMFEKTEWALLPSTERKTILRFLAETDEVLDKVFDFL